MSRALRVPLQPLGSGERILPEAEARYVARVHRLSAGDRFVVFDPEERTEADAEVLSVDRGVRCNIGPVRAATLVARSRITLFQALGKSDKPERVIRDATALGVDRIVFVETVRTVVRLADRARTRRGRWRAVAVDAARQSGRGDVPEIEGPTELARAVENAPHLAPVFRICLRPASERSLADAIRGADGQPLVLLVGPEGGFEPKELEVVSAAGFTFARLGDFVLRTEIAAIAALGAIVAGARHGSG